MIGVVITFGAWAVIGFDGLTGYPGPPAELSEIQSDRSYSIVGMASTAGLGDVVGKALTLLVGGGLSSGASSSRGGRTTSARLPARSPRRSH